VSIRRGTESDLVRALLQLLQLRGVFAWRTQTAGVRRTDRRGRSFWTFAGLRGVADILAVVPPRGQLLAIEAKQPGRGPSAAQLLFAAAVRAAGGLAFICHSVAELETFLEEAGV